MRDEYIIIRDCNNMSYSGELIGTNSIKGEKFIVLKQSRKSDIRLYVPINSCNEIIGSNGESINIDW